MSDLERISLTIDRDLLERFDRLLEESPHKNRSEGFRDLVRARLVEEDWRSADAEVAATVTLVYDHHKREFAEQLLDMGHAHSEHILATMHVHLDHRLCMEVVALRGRAADLRALADRMIGMKGVLHGRLVLTSAEV